MRRSLLLPLLVVATLPTAALAHEYWLSPSTYHAARGDTVTVGAFVGTGFRGEAKPWASPRALRFVLRTSHVTDPSSSAVNGDLVWARFLAPDEGGALLAYQSNYANIELPAAEFDHYLRLEGLIEPLRARAKLGKRAGPGRERYARCPKVWISGSDPSRATSAVGLPLEIVPLGDPSAASPLEMQILYRGKPLRGALVRAWNRPLAPNGAPQDPATRDSVAFVAHGRTNSRGVVKLDARSPGEWLVSAVHMVPSEDKADADWQSLWASLAFARPGKK